MRLNAKYPYFTRLGKETKTGERGFTLLETTIAVVVMMVAALAAASLFLYSINYNSGSNDRALAIAVAQQRLEQYRSVNFFDASLNATAGTTTTVTSGGRSYSVLTTIVNTSTTLKTITIRVTPQGASDAWARTPVILATQRASPITGTY